MRETLALVVLAMLCMTMVSFAQQKVNLASVLQEERTMEFENEIPDPPDPNDWFKATIKVSDKSVEVYVDAKTKAVLKVERLTSTEFDFS